MLVVLGIYSSEYVVLWLFIHLDAAFSFIPKSQSFLLQMIKLFYDLMYCLSLVSWVPPLENSPQIEVRKMTAKGGGGERLGKGWAGRWGLAEANYYT